jgi:hypothetical protein
LSFRRKNVGALTLLLSTIYDLTPQKIAGFGTIRGNRLQDCPVKPVKEMEQTKY